MSDLALAETDEDFVRLVDSLSGDNPTVVKDICTIADAALRFQGATEYTGHVNFHLNSFANCDITFIQNATQTQPGEAPRVGKDDYLKKFS